jgi:hypothetical protein
VPIFAKILISFFNVIYRSSQTSQEFLKNYYCLSEAVNLLTNGFTSYLPVFQKPSNVMRLEHVKSATQEIKTKARFQASDMQAIGTSCQMHGLVLPHT